MQISRPCSLSLLFALCACGPDVVPAAAWEFDVDPGTRVIEGVAVQPAGRAAEPVRITPMVRVSGGDDPLRAASRVAVDRSGRIYVLDEVDQQVRVYTPEGLLEHRLGGPGHGPGEMSPAVSGMVLAGDRLLLADAMLGRLTAWNLETMESETVPLAMGEGLVADALQMQGRADGSVVVLYSQPDVGGASRSRSVRLGADGQMTEEYGAVPERYTTIDLGGNSTVLPVARGQNQIAVAPDGRVYMTGADRYEVLALASDGTPRWVLRVPWERAPMPEQEVERAFEAVVGMLRAMGEAPVLDRSTISDLPALLPALESIKVDGQGRLWVFPYVYHPRDAGLPEGDRPVDVYDHDGRLLYSGVVPARFALNSERGSAWMTVGGALVYGVEADPETGDPVIVGYRLELPVTP